MPVNPAKWAGSLSPIALIPTAESGAFKFAERITYTEQLAGKYNDAFTYANSHHRGSIWTISVGTAPFATVGQFCVEDSALESQKGGKGIVTVNYLYLGVTPPDEFSVTPFEISPPIEKNKYFKDLTQADLNRARQAMNAGTAGAASVIANAIEQATNKTLTQALVTKLSA